MIYTAVVRIPILRAEYKPWVERQTLDPIRIVGDSLGEAIMELEKMFSEKNPEITELIKSKYGSRAPYYSASVYENPEDLSVVLYENELRVDVKKDINITLNRVAEYIKF